jgi:hypothetical protein
MSEWRTIPIIEAYCETCDWEAFGRNAQAIGAIHARSHGHYVTVMVHIEYVYNHDPERQGEDPGDEDELSTN